MAGILSMFAASPFKPLRKHMEKVSECCGCIKALIEKTLSGNIDKNTQIAERIRLLEIDANRLKNDVRIAATDRIMLPFDRVDLLELVTEQDKLANGAKGIAGLLEGRRLKVPKDHQESLIALVKSVLQGPEGPPGEPHRPREVSPCHHCHHREGPGAAR